MAPTKGPQQQMRAVSHLQPPRQAGHGVVFMCGRRAFVGGGRRSDAATMTT